MSGQYFCNILSENFLAMHPEAECKSYYNSSRLVKEMFHKGDGHVWPEKPTLMERHERQCKDKLVFL